MCIAVNFRCQWIFTRINETHNEVKRREACKYENIKLAIGGLH